ncbi:phytochrome C [Andrographis paniculata]|uniref:phytochrome C n=1 Tax=Andrographis paniculata TaxID=175694 RepID=UPI0021E73621|nr:phytochrome C [Andrographis paniculata]
MSSKSNTNKTSCSRSSSAKSKQIARIVAQTPIDAKLHEDFEQSERQFDYSTSVNTSNAGSDVPSSTVSSYLQKMQRGSLIQPFGCLIAIDEQSFRVLAYSENAPEMLDLLPHAVPSMEQQEVLSLGTDVRLLFKSLGAAALQKAANFGEVNVLNPILVHTRTSGKPFYAILHHIDVGLVIDLEPVNPSDVPVTAAGALKSYKLAAKAISKLQSLPSGNISLLCDVLVREVKYLTDYDRVMVYKFHEDDHGEVVAESRRPDLEPYLGLHYPATDIPQASRFLFMKNKVRMICDCLAHPVKVIQDGLAQPLSLAGSTLRAPHGCHAQYMENMGSIASLVMSVMINEEDEDDDVNSNQQRSRKLWGLVVCHHTSPRFVPFPLRYACEFLIQVFGVQINKEVELEAQLRERHILQTQTVLCDLLLRDAPMGIITQSPNVMDLVRCDGAALYYRKKFWLLGVTPLESQIKDIVEWLLVSHADSTGLSTDSLMEAGYPGASILGDAVCGMATIKITTSDFLFWFRSHTEKEIKWGGAKHDPSDKDDGRKMHPRSSFKAFLEVVKNRSLPWEDVEMDAIHSLQLILRESLQEKLAGDSKMIVSVPSVETSIQRVDELRVVTNEMVHLIETASIPILAVDASGNINGWNTKVAELTGLDLHKVLGTPFVDLIVDDAIEPVNRTLAQALQGKEEKNVEIKLKTFGAQENDGPITLVANACCSRDVKENIVGVCFVGQDVTGQKMILDKYSRVQGDYVGIMRSPCPLIPPIFMMDENGLCVEWNNAMQKLSGLKREEAIGQMLLGEVFTEHPFGCQVKDPDTLTKLRILLNTVIAGQNADKLVFGFFDQQQKYIEALISANKRTDSEGRVSGVLCFLHISGPELQRAMQVQKIAKQAAANTIRKLAYIRHEMSNPLSGVKCIHNLMTSTDLNNEQKQILKISQLCCDQIAKIMGDTDVEGIEESCIEINSDEFNLGETLQAVLYQVMSQSREQRVQIICDLPSDVSSMFLYGDGLRLQQVLADFLATALLFTPDFQGSIILFKLVPSKEFVGTRMQVLHVEFRISHPSPGVPKELIQEMFCYSNNVSREGLGLYISQKLVRIMNGTVQYLREADKASFIIKVEFPFAKESNSS